MGEDDVEAIKRRLQALCAAQVRFNEPHFSQQLRLREGNKQAVIDTLLKPHALVYSYQEAGRQGDVKHLLHFKISNTRTMKLPVIFDARGVFVLTFIMRYRNWQHMVRRR